MNVGKITLGENKRTWTKLNTSMNLQIHREIIRQNKLQIDKHNKDK